MFCRSLSGRGAFHRPAGLPHLADDAGGRMTVTCQQGPEYSVFDMNIIAMKR